MKNDIDTAFDWLNRAIDNKQPALGIRTDSFLKNLLDDARWNPVLKNVGLTDEQVAAIEF